MKTTRYTKKDKKKISEELLNSKIIAFPTDTVFGLACVYDSEEAKDNIIKAKGRDEGKPLPMMCSINQIETVAYINNKDRKIIEKFMPGAITLVLKKKDLPDFVTSGKDTIAIRVPDDQWIIDLIQEVGKPLLVTSANLSDKGSLLKCEDVLKDMDNRIDGIVLEDAKGLQASTIVCTIEDIKIFREGPISLEAIKEAIYE